MSDQILGVGIAGAGPVTQAIHLPTLSRMRNRFVVANVMDVSSEVASTVAARAGAQASTTLEDLLEDESVDVVAICSPPQFHAKQVIAALEAGKKAVLCEKPLASSPEEAEAIAEASERFGVPMIVGAMHAFDPAWQAALGAWRALAVDAHMVRSRIVLAPNDRYEDWSTEVLSRPPMNMGGGGADPAGEAQAMLSATILGLTVHDLPLVRSLLPVSGELAVDSARLIAPFGYVISGSRGGTALELIGSINGHWESYWELEAISQHATLRLRFTPSYVHAGSAVATIEHSDGTTQILGPFEHNGYEAEWRSLHRAVTGDPAAVPAPSVFLDDLAFVLDIAGFSSIALAKEFQS